MSGCTRSNTDGSRVKLYSRPGNDLTDRFPLIVEALAGLRSRSCIIDRKQRVSGGILRRAPRRAGRFRHAASGSL